MTNKNSLSSLAVSSAILVGFILGIGIHYLRTTGQDLYINFYLNFSISGGLALSIFNWQTLSDQKKAWRYWLIIGSVLLLGIGILWLNLQPDTEATYFYSVAKRRNFDIFFFLLSAITVIAFLLLFQALAKPNHNIDENFNRATHQFLFNSLVYGGFLLLSVIILFLGFALMNLLGWDLWQKLGERGQSMVIGLVLGANLLFLNLIPSFSNRHRPPAFLFIFPSIILGFIGIYLLALPFKSELITVIDSSVRLITAGILWLFLIYLNDPQRRGFNAIASAAGLILTAMSLQGMLIRIDEYGLTLDRIYALLVIVLLFSGHGLIFLKALTTKYFPRFSAICLPLMMGIFVFLFGLATFIPAVQWSLDSQIARYTTGAANLKNIRKTDFQQFGKEGEKALQQVREFHRDNPQFLARIEDLDKSREELREEKQKNALSEITLIPADLQLSEAVKNEFLSSFAYSHYLPADSVVLAIDANHDGKKEILVFLASSKQKKVHYELYFFPNPDSENHWKEEIGELDPQKLLTALKAGNFQYQKPHFDGVKIDGLPQIDFPNVK